MDTLERDAEPKLALQDRRRLMRLTVWGFATAITLGYLVLIPMKLYGLLPPQMTWIRLLAGVALLGATPAAELLALFCFNGDRARTIALLVIYGIGAAIAFLTIGFATGWR